MTNDFEQSQSNSHLPLSNAIIFIDTHYRFTAIRPVVIFSHNKLYLAQFRDKYLISVHPFRCI